MVRTISGLAGIPNRRFAHSTDHAFPLQLEALRALTDSLNKAVHTALTDSPNRASYTALKDSLDVVADTALTHNLDEMNHTALTDGLSKANCNATTDGLSKATYTALTQLALPDKGFDSSVTLRIAAQLGKAMVLVVILLARP